MPYLLLNEIDNEKQIEIISDEKIKSYKDYYTILNIELFDIVQTNIYPFVLIVDDCGAINDSDINLNATKLYGSKLNYIFGKAILARRDGPNILPLYPAQATALEKLLETPNPLY